MNESLQAPSSSARRGVEFGLLAYVCWGFFPVYFKILSGVPPLEVLGHRVLWSAVVLLLLVGAMGKTAALRAAFRRPRLLLGLACSTLLLALNWLVFLYAVASGRVLQSSLGYFINPLVSVLLGFLFLRERLRPWQRLSLALAVAGVLHLAVAHGEVPWISLVLAVSFGAYGLLRKTAGIDGLLGLTVETCLLAPAALAGVLLQLADGSSHLVTGTPAERVFLPLAGVVTALPLLLFAGAARRLRLATVGFLQYLTPTLHFLLAVVVYREPFTRVHLTAFALIWSGLAVYTLDALREYRAGEVPETPGAVARASSPQGVQDGPLA